MQPLRRATLTEDVYSSLQTLIMDHEIAPGDRLNIDALARQLAVSPTPVREALARLESDGLVRKRALIGYTVTPVLSRREFDELYDMRLVLEPAAARRAASSGLTAVQLRSLADEAQLPPLQQNTTGYAGYADFTRRDATFHHLVAELSGNRLLHESVQRLRFHLHLFRMDFPASHGGVSATEHARIVEAVSAGDPDGAADAMQAHLTAARARHLPYFEGDPA